MCTFYTNIRECTVAPSLGGMCKCTDPAAAAAAAAVVVVAVGGGVVVGVQGAMQQNTFDGCEIRTPPKPAGASVEPLLAMGADGFHNAGNRVGRSILNYIQNYIQIVATSGFAMCFCYFHHASTVSFPPRQMFFHGTSRALVLGE